MKVLLADDESLAIRRLSKLLATFQEIEIIGAAANGIEALELIRALRPDLVFLDIEMPGQSGIELAGALGKAPGPEVVFVTAFDGYAADAFSVDATDYLLKPINPERLKEAIYRAQRRKRERLAHLTASSEIDQDTGCSFSLSNGRTVPEREIVWIEAAKDYALIHTTTGCHIVRSTMSQLSRQLEPRFVRVHRSALIAVRWIQKVAPPRRGMSGIVLKDGTAVPIGPSYLHSTRTALESHAT